MLPEGYLRLGPAIALCVPFPSFGSPSAARNLSSARLRTAQGARGIISVSDALAHATTAICLPGMQGDSPLLFVHETASPLDWVQATAPVLVGYVDQGAIRTVPACPEVAVADRGLRYLRCTETLELPSTPATSLPLEKLCGRCAVVYVPGAIPGTVRPEPAVLSSEFHPVPLSGARHQEYSGFALRFGIQSDISPISGTPVLDAKDHSLLGAASPQPPSSTSAQQQSSTLIPIHEILGHLPMLDAEPTSEQPFWVRETRDPSQAYVLRPADYELEEWFANYEVKAQAPHSSDAGIIAPQSFGKTALFRRFCARNRRYVAFEVSIPHDCQSVDDVFYTIVSTLNNRPVSADGRRLPTLVDDLDAWWRSQRRPHLAFSRFVEDVLYPRIRDMNIDTAIIFMDNLENLEVSGLYEPFRNVVEDLIRSRRRPVRFVLSGHVGTPRGFDTRGLVSRWFDLGPFDLLRVNALISVLRKRLHGRCTVDISTGPAVLHWTWGHPLYTQRLLQRLLGHAESARQLDGELVAKVAHGLIRDFDYPFDSLAGHLQRDSGLRVRFERCLRGTTRWTGASDEWRLVHLGLVRRTDEGAEVFNRLLLHAFDPERFDARGT